MMKRQSVIDLDSSSEEDESCMALSAKKPKSIGAGSSSDAGQPPIPAPENARSKRAGKSKWSLDSSSDEEESLSTLPKQAAKQAGESKRNSNSSSDEEEAPMSKQASASELPPFHFFTNRIIERRIEDAHFSDSESGSEFETESSSSNKPSTAADLRDVQQFLAEKKDIILNMQIPERVHGMNVDVHNECCAMMRTLFDRKDCKYELQHAVLCALMGSTEASVADNAAHSGEQLRQLWQCICSFSSRCIKFAADYYRSFESIRERRGDQRLIPFQRLFRAVFLREDDSSNSRYTDVYHFLSSMDDARTDRDSGKPVCKDLLAIIDLDFYKEKYERLLKTRDDSFVRTGATSRSSTNKRKEPSSEHLRAYPFLPVIPYEEYLQNETIFKQAFEDGEEEAIDRLRALATCHGATLDELKEAHNFETKLLDLQKTFYEKLFCNLFYNQSELFKHGDSTGVNALYIFSGTATNSAISKLSHPDFHDSMSRLNAIRTFHRLMNVVYDPNPPTDEGSHVQIHQKIRSERLRVQQLVETHFHVVVMLCSWIEKLYNYSVHPEYANSVKEKRSFKSSIIAFKPNDIDALSNTWKSELAVKKSKSVKKPESDTVRTCCSYLKEMAKTGLQSQMIDKQTLRNKLERWSNAVTSFKTRLSAFTAEFENIYRSSERLAREMHEKRKELDQKFCENPESLTAEEVAERACLVPDYINDMAIQGAVKEHLNSGNASDEAIKTKSQTHHKWSKDALTQFSSHVEAFETFLSMYKNMLDGMHLEPIAYDLSEFFNMDELSITLNQFVFSCGSSNEITRQAVNAANMNIYLSSYHEHPKEWVKNAFSCIEGCFYKAGFFLGFDSSMANPAPIHSSRCFPIISKAVIHAMLTVCQEQGHLLITNTESEHEAVVKGETCKYLMSAFSSVTKRDMRFNGNMRAFAEADPAHWKTCLMLLRISGSFLDLNNGIAFDRNDVKFGGDEHFVPATHSSVILGLSPAPFVKVKEPSPLSRSSQFLKVLGEHSSRQYPSRVDWHFEDIDFHNYELLRSLWEINSEIFKQNAFCSMSTMQSHSVGNCIHFSKLSDVEELKQNRVLHFHTLCEVVQSEQVADQAIHGNFGI